MPKKIRIFLDTNVLFSALYSATGAPNRIIEAHLRGEIEAVVSRQVLRELIANISKKKPDLLPLLRFLLEEVPFEVQPDPSDDEIHRWTRVIHPADAPILAAAIAAKPDYLVTGNRAHFTDEVATASALCILTPSQAIETLPGRPADR